MYLRTQSTLTQVLKGEQILYVGVNDIDDLYSYIDPNKLSQELSTVSENENMLKPKFEIPNAKSNPTTPNVKNRLLLNTDFKVTGNRKHRLISHANSFVAK